MRDYTSSQTVVDFESELEAPQLQEPRMYKVFILNDDYTPMDFVVGVLKQFFAMAESQATQVMLQVHTQGKGSCGIYTRDVAETKVHLVNTFSQMSEYPLLCSMERL
jgi:ATP-dependent Clp protease adaptor protein ClpS